MAAIARRKKIVVLKSEPCLEALLLRILGYTPTGDADALKRQLRKILGDPADVNRYATSFTAPILEASRGREPAIDGLLALFSTQPRQRAEPRTAGLKFLVGHGAAGRFDRSGSLGALRRRPFAIGRMTSVVGISLASIARHPLDPGVLNTHGQG